MSGAAPQPRARDHAGACTAQQNYTNNAQQKHASKRTHKTRNTQQPNKQRNTGLCHDLGHGPFSHVFENELLPRVLGAAAAASWRHEDMSERVLDRLVDANHVDLCASLDLGGGERRGGLGLVKDLMRGCLDGGGGDGSDGGHGGGGGGGGADSSPEGGGGPRGGSDDDSAGGGAFGGMFGSQRGAGGAGAGGHGGGHGGSGGHGGGGGGVQLPSDPEKRWLFDIVANKTNGSESAVLVLCIRGGWSACGLVATDALTTTPPAPYRSRIQSNHIHNTTSSQHNTHHPPPVDCDKFDYLARDSRHTGVAISLDFRRIMHYSRISPSTGQVVFKWSEYENLCAPRSGK